jgi:hypothetical protein
MKRLGKDLKRALAALAYQDAADYLSMTDKMKVIGYGNETENKPFDSPRLVSNSFAKKRIAMISDGQGSGPPLDYVIDACKRQNADIDLLLHKKFDSTGISLLESHIHESGLQCQRIQLTTESIDRVIEYISKHSSLIFMVGMPDDPIAKLLMEEIIPSPEHHIAVPLVLIDGKKSELSGKKSAA